MVMRMEGRVSQVEMKRWKGRGEWSWRASEIQRQLAFLAGTPLTSCWPAIGCRYLTSCEWRYTPVTWCLKAT
jgi:hypothetical protein